MEFVKLLRSLQVDIKRSVEGGEKRFNQLSIEERGKFDEETLVNVNNVKRHKSTKRSSSFSNEYIVVCIFHQLITFIKVYSFFQFWQRQFKLPVHVILFCTICFSHSGGM
jgi:Protein of unknown function (DUF1517)